jgi:hypothetical protein
MKKGLFIFFVLSLCFYVNPQDISLYSVTGLVKIKADENAANWTVAKAGQKLALGNLVFTGLDSTAIIQTVNAKIEVKALSQASVKSLVETKDNIVTDVYVKYGKIKANVDKNKEVKTLFKVRSANSTASVRGTIFTFGESTLFVEDGTVQLVNDYENSALVQKGERADIINLDVIKAPNRTRDDDYYVNPLPTGVSDLEAGGGSYNRTRLGRITSKAVVIIKIVVD